MQDKWSADIAQRAAVVVKVQAKQAEATVQIVTRYIDRVQVIEKAATQLSQEIPHYVTHQDDAGCTINRGFVRVLDAAAANTLPDPTGITDALPAPITLSTVAESVADNYATCNANSEQLIGLHEWVREMQKAQKGHPLIFRLPNTSSN